MINEKFVWFNAAIKKYARSGPVCFGLLIVERRGGLTSG